MMAHVPTGLPATQGVFSNAHGSALHRTYAVAATQPTGNTATPSQSPEDVWASPPSPEHSMQEPAMGRSPLPENPQPHAVKIHSREIVACHIAAIPPTGLDALRLAEESQWSPAPWETIAFGEKARLR